MNKEIDEILEEASVKSVGSETDNLPESPNSANIKVWIRGFGVQFTMRDNQMINVIQKIEKLIQLAEEKKWQPTWEVKVLPKQDPTMEIPTQLPKIAPKCSIHGIDMVWRAGISKKTGKPYGFWACSQKLANGDYCNGKPMEGNV
jgi:hypothetical protein